MKARINKVDIEMNDDVAKDMRKALEDYETPKPFQFGVFAGGVTQDFNSNYAWMKFTQKGRSTIVSLNVNPSPWYYCNPIWNNAFVCDTETVIDNLEAACRELRIHVKRNDEDEEF